MIEWLTEHPEAFVAWWLLMAAVVTVLMLGRPRRTRRLTDEDVRRASRAAHK